MPLAGLTGRILQHFLLDRKRTIVNPVQT